MLRLFTNRYDNRKFRKKKKKKPRYFQANLFDKLVIRHRSPLRSIFFFDFHLKTTSGVHDSSLSPLLIFSFPSKRERSNYVGSSLAIFLKISGPGRDLIQGNQDILEPRAKHETRAFPCIFSFFLFFLSKKLPKDSNHMTGSGKFERPSSSLSPPLSR